MEKPKIKFGDREVEADVRMLNDMKKVIYDKKWLRNTDNRPLYYMYRDLYLPKHKETIRENNLRFDMTVIPPALLGKEYVKTKGHYHSMARKGITYPEIYGVIQGEAHYLLQKVENGEVKDVVLFKASAGDKVIIPPNYGHITINPSDETLKMGNWICPENESSYKDISENKGGAYFETTDGFVKNGNYKEIPSIRFKEPKNIPDLDITSKKPLYRSIKEPSYLRFLKKPEKFQWLFEKII